MNNLDIHNIDKDKIIEKLSTMLKPNRLQHSINVANCAVKLSEIYSYDKDKAYLAGLVHDCAKYFTKDQVDFYVKKYNIFSFINQQFYDILYLIINVRELYYVNI